MHAKSFRDLLKKKKVIGASENFMDEKKLPLPAQMFRMGSELVAENPEAGFYLFTSVALAY